MAGSQDITAWEHVTPLALTQVGPILFVSLPITIVHAASLEVRLDAVTDRTLMRCGFKEMGTIIFALTQLKRTHRNQKQSVSGTELMMVLKQTKKLATHPIGINAFHQRTSSLAGFHGSLQYSIDVDVVALDVCVLVRFWCRPADENGLVQLSLERELPRRRH